MRNASHVRFLFNIYIIKNLFLFVSKAGEKMVNAIVMGWLVGVFFFFFSFKLHLFQLFKFCDDKHKNAVVLKGPVFFPVIPTRMIDAILLILYGKKWGGSKKKKKRRMK